MARDAGHARRLQDDSGGFLRPEPRARRAQMTEPCIRGSHRRAFTPFMRVVAGGGQRRWTPRRSISERTTAARPAAARNARDAVGVVVVGQLLAFADVARGANPDVTADDVDIAVGTTGVIDVARDVAAKRRIARPSIVDDEDPDALARQVAALPAPRFRLRDQLPLVLD